MSESNLLKYLLISPNLPVGGFCYSEGMESYLHNKNLTDSNSVKDLIISELKIGQIRLDARLLLDFFDIFNEINYRKNLNGNLQKLMSLDKWILSSKDSLEIREQQIQMAKSLFDLTKEFGFEYLYENNKKSSWSLAWSWACYCFEITKLEMVENFFFAWSANQLSAALRIIPIGSTKAQLIQRDLLEIISKVSKEIMDKEIDDIYFGNVGLAMAQQNQMAKSLFDLTKEFGFEYLYENNKKSSWSLAWSWACYCFEITKLEMVENFFYAWSANQLSAALRIIPIGSTKAQLIQRDLLAIISKVSKEIMDKEIDDIYFGNVGLAMAQQNHNDLYTKLFRN